MTVALQQLTAADFQPQIGKNFLIHFSTDVVTQAQLEKVVDLPAHPNLQRRPFSILLQTTQNLQYYPQAIYTIEHSAWGSLQIFLVPVGRNEKGVQYEAVFS